MKEGRVGMEVQFHATGKLVKLFLKTRYTLHEADEKLKEVAKCSIRKGSSTGSHRNF